MSSLTTDQLRERRRQKILARSQASSRIVRYNELDEDGVPSNNDSMQTCCMQQHSTAVNSDDKWDFIHADCVASMADAGAANDFEFLDETQHTQPHRPDSDYLLSGSSTKLHEYNDQIMVSWQRTRSLIMVVLGLVVRFCFYSVFLSQFMQTIFYPFVATEIVLFGFERSTGMVWKEDTSGGMLAKLWLLVFQLAGLRPSAVQTYSRLLALLAVIGDDFAIYFFTFLITHIFLSQ